MTRPEKYLLDTTVNVSYTDFVERNSAHTSRSRQLTRLHHLIDREGDFETRKSPQTRIQELPLLVTAEGRRLRAAARRRLGRAAVRRCGPFLFLETRHMDNSKVRTTRENLAALVDQVQGGET
jgi:hypothetical protein